MSANTGPRIMTKEVPAYGANFDPATLAWPGQSGWENVQSVAPNQTGIYWESYFDLSGYNQDDLTVIPTLLELQDPMMYYFSNPPAGSNEIIQLVDVISMERLNAEAVFNDLFLGNVPGSPLSDTNYEQLPMVNSRITARRTDLATTNLHTVTSAGSMGSGEPTTVKKLWCYRFVMILPEVPLIGGENLQVPATRFILASQIVRESELSHMMRLKRSYELSTN